MSDLINLVLQPDNPCNTVITDQETDKIVYRVTTEHEPKTVTRVKNAAGATVASNEWRDVRSDVITIGNGEPIAASAWLKKSMVPFTDTVKFQGADGKNFKWKGNGPGLSFELYSEENKSQPIARFHKSHRALDKTTSPPTQEWVAATLVVDGRREYMLDQIVTSFLFLEKSRRATESSTMNKADVLGAAHTIV